MKLAVILRAMLTAGCSAEQIVAAACAHESANQDAIELRRANDRVRKARQIHVKSRERSGKTVIPAERLESPPTDPQPKPSTVENNQPPPTPLPPSANAIALSDPRQSKSNRGTRLPNDFVMPDEWKKWALAEGLRQDLVELQAAKFTDFWRAKAGKDAVRTDWLMTWRNWVRGELERRPQSRAPPAAESKRLEGIWLAFDTPEFSAWKAYQHRVFSKRTVAYRSKDHPTEGNYFPARWPPNHHTAAA